MSQTVRETERSIQEILRAPPLVVHCYRDGSPCKTNGELCCICCEEFQTCTVVCEHAERWDIHLEKCQYVEVEE